ncbi:MAG TPA: UDP-N-acetylmuramoyl-tripeptide--D-alanyl-D-alanine ligase [Acidimicrobiia bacterium]|nr:UDP-N-acetylmuramoyl-tripeptide--D-alanyl-D-alanine ligase [Acidimicrobiia bacterium]
MDLTLGEIAAATDAQLIGGEAGTVISSFDFDTRTLERGACFVALQGERDGHEFVGDAFARGAGAALVDHVTESGGGVFLVVADPLVALGELGRVARRRIPGATVIGVTGSAGKTATKDLMAAACGRQLTVHANADSYNNEFGLPLTLLGAPMTTQVLIAEMGARFAGNITELSAIARPEIGVVTHIGLAHAEHLGGTEGIATVKGELLEALPASGLAVLNADDPATTELAGRTRARVLRVGADAVGADVRAHAIELDDELRPRFALDTPWGSLYLALAVRGRHQVINAAMGATVALALGVGPGEVTRGLADATTAPWRMQLCRTADDVLVLNDAYNASPSSVRAAFAALSELSPPGRRLAVLGTMLELGGHAEVEHARLGRLAADAGVEVLILVGPGVTATAAAASERGIRVIEVPDAPTATVTARELLEPGDAILVKASRAVGLEAVAADLESVHGEPTPSTPAHRAPGEVPAS